MRKFELLQLRAKAFADARAYVDQAEKENRDMNVDEKSAFDKAMQDIAALDARVTALEQVEAAEPEAEPVTASRSNKMAIEKRDLSGSDLYASKEYRSAWIKANILGDRRAADEEMRTVNMTSGGNGQYTVTPTEIISDVQALVENYVWMKKFAKSYKTTSPVARIPLLTTRMAAAAYGSTEITSVTADTTQAFTKRDLTPHVLAALVKISVLATDISNLEDLVTREIGIAFSYAMENKFLNGSGTNEPLGVFTASSNGISTARDVTTSTTTSIDADSLFACKYKIPQQYLNDPSVGWIFHRDAMKIVATLKDSQNRYLLNPGLNGEPDNLLGYPVRLSEYAPNTFTAGLYVGILGAFNQYATVDVTPGVEIVRLNELYAATHEVGLLGRSFNDGAPILEQGFARLITAAS